MRARLQNLTPAKLKLGWIVAILSGIIIIFGLVAVYNASVAEGLRDYGNKYHFVTQQIKWAVLGLIAAGIASKIPLPLVKKFTPIFFVVVLALMVAVLIPGLGSKVQGARRWLSIGGFTLQPTEALKFSMVLYLASFLEKRTHLKGFLFVVGLVVGLTMLQPDLGTTIILVCLSFLVYYLSGAPLKQLMTIASLAAIVGSLLIVVSPYRRARLSTYLDPTNDPLGSSYHINQVLLALGSGGWDGVGLGRSRQKYDYLPEATTDSIFAVIGEEIGFIGGVIIIALLLALVLFSFQIARQASTRYHQLLAAGIASWLGAQTLLNLAAMVALVPLTGIPLPFVSYGGSALVAAMTGIGLLLNIANTEKI